MVSTEWKKNSQTKLYNFLLRERKKAYILQLLTI